MSQNNASLANNDVSLVINDVSPPNALHDGQLCLKEQEDKEKSALKQEYKLMRRKLKENKLKKMEKEEKEKQREQREMSKRTREAIVAEEDSNPKNEEICQGTYSSTGHRCDKSHVDGCHCAVHRDIHNLTSQKARFCVCLMRGNKECFNEAVEGLEIQFCSRHYKTMIIANEKNDNKRRRAV